MIKLKVIKFWCVAFFVLLWHTLKNNNWHMAVVDFHMGDDKDGRPIRKRLIARKTVADLRIEWQHPFN